MQKSSGAELWLTARMRRLTLVACILGSSIVFIDGTVVNVALPTIQRDLGGGLAAQRIRSSTTRTVRAAIAKGTVPGTLSAGAKAGGLSPR